ncbi:ATP/GTP-binding protein [Dietzia psychralcaliphila]|uniref:ATP/GTP-binding protein n=1 Tax=Dietzia psychralcaliphila TaxID=139021 RepID=UPI0020A65D33|nr:ATP/GTP-binding protein [Dietzia psychralcaliphila]
MARRPETPIGPAELEELHSRVTAGDAPPPWVVTPTGRAYKRWCDEHPERAEQVRTARQVPQVRYRKPRFTSRYGSVDGRGFKGAFSGRMAVASAPGATQTSTNYGCGFNPWVVGATAPAVGVPLGVHAQTGQDVSGDVLSWFKAGIIGNPSAFVLSLPGLGKSTLIRKQFIGAVAQGHVPIVAGDIKGEYVAVTDAMVTPAGKRGQVIRLGHGHGHLNPLAAGALGEAIPVMRAHLEELHARGEDNTRLAEAITETEESVHSRQVTMVMALAELIRGRTLADFEGLVISASLRSMRESGQFSFSSPPLLRDLIDFIRSGSDGLRRALFVADETEYRRTVQTLVQTLESLTDGVMGQVFAEHTTTKIDLDAPAICIDVSAISRGDQSLKAGVLLACWSDAYGAMEAAHVLADCGLANQRYFLAILDEMWATLGAGAGMVQRVDELTRLNRTDGTGLLMITHTGRDLETLPNEVDVKTAMGFIERAGMVICGGLPAGELDRLKGVLQFSDAEAAMITAWSKGAPIERTQLRQEKKRPLGQGMFMLKPSKDGTHGIPIHVQLTHTERATNIHDTNTRLREFLDAAPSSQQAAIA